MELARAILELKTAKAEIRRLEHALCGAENLALLATEQKAEVSVAVLACPHLTDSEHDVLLCLMAGDSNKGIGALLYMADGTVKSHISNIFKKLKVHNRAGAVMSGIEHGLGPKKKESPAGSAD